MLEDNVIVWGLQKHGHTRLVKIGGKTKTLKTPWYQRRGKKRQPFIILLLGERPRKCVSQQTEETMYGGEV